MKKDKQYIDKQHTSYMLVFAVAIFLLGTAAVLWYELFNRQGRVSTNLASYKIHGYVPNIENNGVLAAFYEVVIYTKKTEGQFSSYVKDNSVKVGSGMPAGFSFEDWSYNQTFMIAISGHAVIADTRYVNVLIVNKEVSNEL
jgi:hypothetical protein